MKNGDVQYIIELQMVIFYMYYPLKMVMLQSYSK